MTWVKFFVRPIGAVMLIVGILGITFKEAFPKDFLPFTDYLTAMIENSFVLVVGVSLLLLSYYKKKENNGISAKSV